MQSTFKLLGDVLFLFGHITSVTIENILSVGALDWGKHKIIESNLFNSGNMTVSLMSLILATNFHKSSIVAFCKLILSLLVNSNDNTFRGQSKVVY